MEGRAVVLGILVVLISSVFVLGVCTNLGADKVGTIIIFKTYYLPDEVSLDLINIVDDEFLKVFNFLGPFDVEVIDLRLNKDNVEEIFKILSNAKKGKKYEGNYPVVGNSTFGRLAITPEVLSKMMKATYIVFPEIRYLKFSEEYKSSKPVISASSSSMGNYEWEREPIIRMDMVGYIRAVEVGPLKEVKTFNITVTKSDIKPKFGSIDKVKMISDSIRDLRFRIRNFLNIRAVGFVSRVSKGKYIVNVGRNFYLSTGNEFLVFEGKVYSSKDSFSTNLVYKGVAKIWAVGNNYSEIIPSSPNFNIEAGDIVIEFRNNGISLGGYLGVQYTTYRPVSNVTLQNYFNEKWGLSERFVPVVGIWGDTETYTPWIDLIVNVYFAFYKPLLIGVSFYTGLPVYPGGFKVKPYVGFDLVVYSDQLLDYPGMEGTLISPSVGSIDLVV